MRRCFSAISSTLSSGNARRRARRPRAAAAAAAAASAAAEIERALAGLLRAVARREMSRRLLVVAGQRLVGLVGNALAQRLQVEHAEQRVAAADVGVEEAERLAGLDRLDPERDLGQFDRHRVAVDAIEALARDVAQRVAIVARRGDAAGAAARDARGDAPRRREQEMAGAAGGIDDAQREQRIGRGLRTRPRPGRARDRARESSSACTRLSGV